MPETLGLFEQVVLVSIINLRDAAYGRAILREVESRLNRKVVAGAVYATLDRLEAKGLTSSRLGSGTPERGGRPRRFYTLQAKGVAALNQARRTTERIWNGVRWPLRARG
jgi:PadR family transcriptional regulator, regulatory protein PadR